MKKKILIIDDDKEFCEEISEALRYEGYDSDSSNDGLEGSSMLDSDEYDAVVLDLKLPSLSGAEILKRIKETKKDVPVIVCSGQYALLEKFHEDECAKEEACKVLEHAHDVLTKPISLTSLLTAIKRAVHRNRKSKQ